MNWEEKEKIVFFESYGQARAREVALREELAYWRGVSQTLRENKDPLAPATLQRVAELERRQIAAIGNCMETRRQVEQAIATLRDETLRHLMALRYLEGMTWEAVAEVMFYSVSHTYRLHRRALAMARAPRRKAAGKPTK